MTNERDDVLADEGGDLVGPGTGGTPTGAGVGEPIDPAAATEPDVAALIDELRTDGGDARAPADAAAEQVGTGTDR